MFPGGQIILDGFTCERNEGVLCILPHGCVQPYPGHIGY